MFLSRFKADDEFCSIGAGRGDSPTNSDGGDGKVRCDSSSTPYETRELGNSDHHIIIYNGIPFNSHFYEFADHIWHNIFIQLYSNNNG